MNPGFHPFDAGVSGRAPSNGIRVRMALQSPVAWVMTSNTTPRSTPSFAASTHASETASICAA